jgi:hypothetical protein
MLPFTPLVAFSLYKAFARCTCGCKKGQLIPQNPAAVTGTLAAKTFAASNICKIDVYLFHLR